MPRLKKKIDPNLTQQAGYRIKLFVGEDMIGPGKIDLLKHIKLHGSISAAARDLGMNYQRARFLIDTLESATTQTLLETSSGGASGGQASLTAFAEELISTYEKTSQAIDTVIQPTLKWLDKNRNS